MEYVNVSNRDRAAFAKTLNDVDSDTTRIHLSRNPSLRAIRALLKKAPNLEVLQVPPSRLEKMGSKHRAMLEKAGVKLEAKKPIVTRKGRVDRRYQEHRRYFRKLKGEQKRLFEELLAFCIKPALVTERYICWNGEEGISQQEVAKMWEMEAPQRVSLMVCAVRKYLDPAFDTGATSTRMAGAIKTKVKWARQKAEKADENRDMEKLCERLGIVKLPAGLMAKDRMQYLTVIAMYRRGELGDLLAVRPLQYDTLALRYDFEHLDTDEGPVLRSMRDVADMYGVSAQSISARIRKALIRLGIITPGGR